METLRAIVNAPMTERIITALIVINAVILGLETSDTAVETAGPVLRALDMALLGVFTVEIAARILVHGRRFFVDPWSIFDFIIVAISLMPTTGNLSVLRSLRILRAMRLVSTVKSMRRVVGGLLHAIPGMGSIVALLTLIFYVSSVMATKLFGDAFPQWFGTIGESAYSLFQIMTLESWSMGIVRPVMESYPLAWMFFVPFILATSFTVLNLFIGVIVDAMQSQHTDELEEAKATMQADSAAMLNEIRALRGEISALHQRLDLQHESADSAGTRTGPVRSNV